MDYLPKSKLYSRRRCCWGRTRTCRWASWRPCGRSSRWFGSWLSRWLSCWRCTWRSCWSLKAIKNTTFSEPSEAWRAELEEGFCKTRGRGEGVMKSRHLYIIYREESDPLNTGCLWKNCMKNAINFIVFAKNQLNCQRKLNLMLYFER